MLTVTVLSAKDLINLEFARPDQLSSPFCAVMVYPTSPEIAGSLRPYLWCTPAIRNNLSPVWGESHRFQYQWPKARNSVPKARSSVFASKEDELLCVLRELEGELQGMREQVRV